MRARALFVATILTGSFLLFLAPAQAAAFQMAYVIPVVAETGFCLWLLIRGLGPRRR